MLCSGSPGVPEVTFTDEDLDAEDLGGRIYWDSPAEFSQVTGYNIYISQIGRQIGSVVQHACMVLQKNKQPPVFGNCMRLGIPKISDGTLFN